MKNIVNDDTKNADIESATHMSAEASDAMSTNAAEEGYQTPDADGPGESPVTATNGNGGRSDTPPKAPPFAADGNNDDFDFEKLRLNQDFSAAAGVKKVITVLPCRKPNRQEFIRVRPGEEWRLETAVYEDKVSREIYLVARELWHELPSEISPVCLLTTITRQGDVFVWPVKLPRADGRTNPWNESAISAARMAEAQWVRVAANMNAGYYDTFAALGELTDPVWPTITFDEVLRVCFKGHLIRDTNHPILRALRGEA